MSYFVIFLNVNMNCPEIGQCPQNSRDFQTYTKYIEYLIDIWNMKMQNKSTKLYESKYIKTSVKRPLSKRSKIGFQDQFLLNAGQKYCRMLPLVHPAVLSTFIKLPFVVKTFVLSIFVLPF